MFLYSCKALYRHVSLLLTKDYADFADFLATNMHKKHKETKEIAIGGAEILAAFVFRQTNGGQVSANSALTASF
jgi:hypothetical protein